MARRGALPLQGCVLPDHVSQGPLSGILAALEWAEGADAVVSAAVDTPFLPCSPDCRGSGLRVRAGCGVKWRAHPSGLRAGHAVWRQTCGLLSSGSARMMEFCDRNGAARGSRARDA